ncbi:MAG: Uncharacterised protein [Cryomorphaceae bacterium]|nr:MAG: Uncharacterised protein [Cryomorphaceae bacterium]
MHERFGLLTEKTLAFRTEFHLNIIGVVGRVFFAEIGEFGENFIELLLVEDVVKIYRREGLRVFIRVLEFGCNCLQVSVFFA